MTATNHASNLPLATTGIFLFATRAPRRATRDYTRYCERSFVSPDTSCGLPWATAWYATCPGCRRRVYDEIRSPLRRAVDTVKRASHAIGDAAPGRNVTGRSNPQRVAATPLLRGL